MGAVFQAVSVPVEERAPGGGGNGEASGDGGFAFCGGGMGAQDLCGEVVVFQGSEVEEVDGEGLGIEAGFFFFGGFEFLGGLVLEEWGDDILDLDSIFFDEVVEPIGVVCFGLSCLELGEEFEPVDGGLEVVGGGGGGECKELCVEVGQACGAGNGGAVVVGWFVWEVGELDEGFFSLFGGDGFEEFGFHAEFFEAFGAFDEYGVEEFSVYGFSAEVDLDFLEYGCFGEVGNGPEYNDNE